MLVCVVISSFYSNAFLVDYLDWEFFLWENVVIVDVTNSGGLEPCDISPICFYIC